MIGQGKAPPPSPLTTTWDWDGVSRYMLTCAWLTSIPGAASKAWTILM